AECEDTNAPVVTGLWAAGDGRDVVVRIDHTGTAACPAPPILWRVLHARNAAPAADPAEQARALNTRAMRKFRAKDWAGAAADFRAAIDRFSNHVKAHYNLACLASITRDRATALAELRWLAASELPEAEQKILKARTDPDMDNLRDDPEVAEILARAK